MFLRHSNHLQPLLFEMNSSRCQVQPSKNQEKTHATCYPHSWLGQTPVRRIGNQEVSLSDQSVYALYALVLSIAFPFFDICIQLGSESTWWCPIQSHNMDVSICFLKWGIPKTIGFNTKNMSNFEWFGTPNDLGKLDSTSQATTCDFRPVQCQHVSWHVIF